MTYHEMCDDSVFSCAGEWKTLRDLYADMGHSSGRSPIALPFLAVCRGSLKLAKERRPAIPVERNSGGNSCSVDFPSFVC